MHWEYKKTEQIKTIPAEVLALNSCILDEQPDHIVVTLRIPKAAIRDNHALLAALSERCGELSPAMMPIFKNRATRVTAMLALAALVAILIASPVNLSSAAPEAPTQIIDYHIDTPMVPVGGILTYSYVVRRPRVCRVELDRIVSRGGQIVYSTHQYGAMHGLEPKAYSGTRLVELPPHLGEGTYALKIAVYDHCSATEFYQTGSPEMPFQIVAPH